MKSIIATLITLLLSSTAFAALPTDTEIKCNYIVATTLRSYSGIKVIPSEQRGEITLVQENGVFKGEFIADTVLKLNFEAAFAGDLSLTLKVTETRGSYSSKVPVSTTGLFKSDASGSFQGSLIVRAPDVETLALRNKIPFDSAALSESLPTGLNFIGAMLSCN